MGIQADRASWSRLDLLIMEVSSECPAPASSFPLSCLDFAGRHNTGDHFKYHVSWGILAL